MGEWDGVQHTRVLNAVLTHGHMSIFLRHGGAGVSAYLQDELHQLFEAADPAEVPQLVESLQRVGTFPVPNRTTVRDISN